MHALDRDNGLVHGIFLVKGELKLFIKQLGDLEDFADHFLVAVGIVGFHGVFETGVEMAFHEHLVSGFEEADNGKILLHNVDAVFAFFNHFEDFVEVGAGFFEIDEGFGGVLVHAECG